MNREDLKEASEASSPAEKTAFIDSIIDSVILKSQHTENPPLTSLNQNLSHLINNKDNTDKETSMITHNSSNLNINNNNNNSNQSILTEKKNKKIVKTKLEASNWKINSQLNSNENSLNTDENRTVTENLTSKKQFFKNFVFTIIGIIFYFC